MTYMDGLKINYPQPPEQVTPPVKTTTGGTPVPSDGPIVNDYSAMNGDMKQPVTTPTATATQAQQPQAYDPQKYIDAIFKQEVPKPEYDKERQTRNRDLSKVLALGDALSTLGDVFSLSKGANVTARGPNNDVKQLRTEWQGYEDNYKQRMDQYNRDVFQQKLNNLRFGAQMDMAERSYQDQKENQKYNREYQKGRDEVMDQRYKDNKDWIEKTWGSEQEWKKKMFEADQYWKKMGYNLNAAQLNIQKQKAAYDLMQDQLQYQKYLKDLDKDNWGLYDKNSGALITKIGKNNGQLDAAFSVLLKDPRVKDEMDMLAPTMGEKITPQIKMHLLAKHGQDSPDVMKFLGLDGSAINGPMGPPAMPQSYQWDQSGGQYPSPGIVPLQPTNTNNPQNTTPTPNIERMIQSTGSLNRGNVYGQAYDYANKQPGLSVDQRIDLVNKIVNESKHYIQKQDTSELMGRIGFDNTPQDSTATQGNPIDYYLSKYGRQ